MKQNDWIVASLNNPDFTATDFKNILDLSLDNTQLLSKDEYLKSSFITENPLFQGEDGQFDKNKFDNFYNKQVEKFNNFSTESLVDNYQYGFWDTSRKSVKNDFVAPKIGIDIVSNPEHVSKGIVGQGIKGERTKSAEELAQSKRIFDYSEGKFLDETPEDSSLFKNPINFIKNIFSDPLVLAQYEEDGEHIDPITGLRIQHKKGDNKIGNDGEYYYETLGGRSIIGKKVLSVGDILTPEDSALNKFDFFDSDDIEKSAGGVIAKNLALVAPMVFLGPTSSLLYNGFFVTKELAKSLPMLYQMAGTLTGNTEDSETLNTIAAWGQKFSSGTSEYSKEKTFSFENFGNLISDVAMQWGQQRAIAESISRLGNGGRDIMASVKAKAALEYEKQGKNILTNIDKGILDANQGLRYLGIDKADDLASMFKNDKWMNTLVGQTAINKYMPQARKAFENRLRFGQDLSLAYMAIISNTDVYESALQHGATKKEAAGVALGSTLGMFAVDKYLGLGEMFFNDRDQAKIFRQAFRDFKDKELSPIIQAMAKQPESPAKSLNFIRKGIESSKKFLKDYHTGIKEQTLGFFGKSIGEGLEEVSEELVTDVMKSLYQLGGQFGYFSQNDIGAWENMGDRYLMSLFGGMIGGGLFYGIDAIQHPKTKADSNSRDEFLYFVRNGETRQLLEEGEKMYKKGEWGSKTLSMKTVENPETKEKTFLTVNNDNEESQNDFIWKSVRQSILQMDNIINGNQLNISDDKLFERMLLSDEKLMNLEDSQSLKEAAYMSGYFKEYQRIVQDIYDIDSKIQELNNNTSDENKRDENSSYSKELKVLQEKKEELLNRKEEFHNEGSRYYLRKSLFAMNPNISGLLLPINYNRYVRLVYQKNPQDLTQSEQEQAKKDWEEYKKNSRNLDLTAAFELFDKTENNMFSTINEISKEDVLKWKEIQDKLIKYKFKWDDGNVKLENLSQEEKNSLLKELGVTVSDEYDKPWESDPTKSNKARQIHLNEDSHNFFELVKDVEDNFWSIHFKTERDSLNEKQKQKLFQAAALLVPEGDKLSTWGVISQGEISELNKFRTLGFEKTGERTIKRRSPNFKTMTDEELDIQVDKYNQILADSVDNKLDKYVYEQIDNLNRELAKRDKEQLDLSIYTKESTGDQSKLEDVNIPIFTKSSIEETEDEFEHRNKKYDGESDTQFALRKQRREQLLKQQLDRENQKILSEINSITSSIDQNTYRFLISQLGQRNKDIIRFNFNNFLPQLQEVSSLIKSLKDDLSNSDSVWNQISEKIKSQMIQQQKSIIETGLSINNSKAWNNNGIATFDTLISYLNDVANIIGDLTVDDLIEQNIGLDENPYLADFININRVINGESDNVTLESNYEELGLSEGDEISDIDTLNKVRNRIQEIIPPNTELAYNEDLLQDNIKKEQDIKQKEFNQIIDNIKRDGFYSQLEPLKHKLSFDLNPTVKLIKSLVQSLGQDFSDIESTLQTIYETYDELNSITDFQLSEPQVKALEEASKYIQLAQAVIIAASNIDGYNNPLPYNKTINEWLRTHRKEIKEDFEELVELDDDISQVYLQSLNSYQKEINTWITRAKNNQVNKVRMFTEFDTRFEQIKENFFKKNLPHFELPDGSNLLDGFVDKGNPFENVLEYERCVYKNTQKALRNGTSMKDLFSVITKIVNPSIAITQKISNLDLSIKDLTDYDKFVYIVSCMGYNPDNFYTDYKEFIKNNEDIAPLSMQKYAIRVKKAQENNMSFVNQMLDLFKEWTGSNSPILYNATIVTGIGGSGKTSVVVKASINEGAWISGPTSEQIKSLSKLGQNLVAKSKKELMQFVLGDQYTQFYKDQKNPEEAKLLTLKKNKSGNTFDLSKLTFNKTPGAPKQLAIDEITLFSNAEIQAIGRWAKENEVSLLFTGDENQNGDSTTGYNIARENLIAFRVPKLSISLRDGNVWKYQNQKILSELEDRLRNTDKASESTTIAKSLLEGDFKNFRLRYYSQNSTGDQIIDSLTNEQISKLEDNSTLYIGEESDETFNKLKNAGKLKSIDGEVKAYSLDAVQGKEADYVVSNIDITKFDKSDSFDVLDFMRSLYTIITRSSKGALIINNGLTNIIGNSDEQSYSTDVVQFNPESIKQFIDMETQRLENLKLNPEAELSEEVEKETPDPKKAIEVKPGIDNVLNKPLDEEESRRKEEKKNEELPLPEEIQDNNLPIHTYTNFNLLGVPRLDDGTWVTGTRRDVGIFLDNNTKDPNEKDRLVDLFMDLKSNILNNDGFENLPEEARIRIGSEENLKNARYFIVKETYDPGIHRFVTIEQNQKPPVNSTIYTLQMRINNGREELTITLGLCADPDNMHKEIIEDQLKRSKEPNAKQILDNLDTEIANYKLWLHNIETEQEIDAPYFEGFNGLRRIKHTFVDPETDEIVTIPDVMRLEEVNSPDSFYKLVTKYYVTSPIYTQMAGDSDTNSDNIGKPFILVSSLRRFSPDELLDEYEAQQRDLSRPVRVRKIFLSSAGVSFESLFSSNYKSSYNVVSMKNERFTFPFDLIPMGVRMYTALWNWRANLTSLVEPLVEKYKNLDELTRIVKEEDRLYQLANSEWKNQDSTHTNLTSQQFENWLNSNESQIQENLTKDQIFEFRQFNDNIKGPIKLGWNQENGAYVRKINSEDYGVYLNPELAIQYLTTVENIFKYVLDEIIPNVSSTGIGVNELISYKKTEAEWTEQEKNWVRKARNGKVLLKVESNGETVQVDINKADLLKGIPLIITEMTKNIQATTRMSNMENVMKDYDSNKDSHYAIQLQTASGEEKFVKYLKVLEGGLGNLIHTDSTADLIPGVFKGAYNPTTKTNDPNYIRDRRLINMFNLAFHGSTYTGEANSFDANPKYAKYALFGHGFFVDPILGKRMETNGEKYRPIIISGKYYYTDSVPTSPKVFFLARNKSVKKEKEIIKEEEKQNNPVLQQLIDTGLVTRQAIEECESIEEMVEETNNILRGTLSKIINNNDVTDIDNFKNMIYKVTFEDEKLKFYKVSEHPKIKGKNIQFILQDNNKYIDIDEVINSIKYIDNNLDFEEELAQGNGTYSLQGVLNYIESQAIGNEAESFKQSLGEGTNLNEIYTIEDLVSTLDHVIENSSDEDLNYILKQIINNPDCIL